MTKPDLNAIWDSFLAAWPPDRVRTMSLAEYTNLEKDDAFVYWLEVHTERLGDIHGGYALKWGVYQRSPGSKPPQNPGMLSDDTYSWYGKYGATAEEAFRALRDRLVEVVDAAQAGDLDRIEATDACWPMVKWKVAFLYQDRTAPRVFPVYRDDRLLHHYRLVEPAARQKDVSRAVMYPTLLDRYASIGDVFDVAHHVWTEDGTPAKARYWAVPLHYALPTEAAKALCQLPEVNPEDVPEMVDGQLADAEVALGDHLALIVDDTVLAVGKLESAEPGAYAWSQRSVEVTPDMVIPAKVVELDASERESIWSAIVSEPAPSGVPQFWKVAPGENAHLWEAWKTGNYIAIGWDKFGDVSKLSRHVFEQRLKEFQGLEGYGNVGPRQVWRFRNIPVGSRVVINQGKRKVLAVGTVIGPYEYHPGVGEYCHRLRVRWDDLTERAVEQPGWQRTLIELSEAEFKAILKPPEGGPDREPPEPCPEPRSIILYGPPGTGKTWSTTERALQLLGLDGVASMSADTRAQQFRRLQREGRIEFVTFHQAYGYEEFVEGIRPVLAADATGEVSYELHAGTFKRIALRAASEGLRKGRPAQESDADRIARAQEALDRPDRSTVDFQFTKTTPPYVLIIDEINRGNISKILGELITLLEPDKRLGSPNELKLPLAYSPQHRFSVPPNLHILGTMNTADRSIALMDVALRRRFRFEELLPDSGVLRVVLRKDVANAALVELICDLFDTLNMRIRFLYDRDHQIGHAYFLGIRSLEDLRDVFADRVIPLLQEYFYGAWDKVCLVLGCPYDDGGRPQRKGPCLAPDKKGYLTPMVRASVQDEIAVLGFDHEEMEGKLDREIAPTFRPRAGGGAPDVDVLVSAFLTVLNLDETEWKHRAAALIEGVAT
jgi:5-methylcytosine-specific restriction endonuclease McrBC GTP-binding regulatory subunit McrB